MKIGDPVAWVRYDDGLTQEFPMDRLRLADFRHSAPWREVRSRPTLAGELDPKALIENEADRIAKDADVTQIKADPSRGDYTAKGWFGTIEGTLTGIDLSKRS